MYLLLTTLASSESRQMWFLKRHLRKIRKDIECGEQSPRDASFLIQSQGLASLTFTPYIQRAATAKLHFLAHFHVQNCKKNKIKKLKNIQRTPFPLPQTHFVRPQSQRPFPFPRHFPLLLLKISFLTIIKCAYRGCLTVVVGDLHENIPPLPSNIIDGFRPANNRQSFKIRFGNPKTQDLQDKNFQCGESNPIAPATFHFTERRMEREGPIDPFRILNSLSAMTL